MVTIVSDPSLALIDFRLLPGLTEPDSTVDKVALGTRLCRSKEGFLRINLPLVSAPMQAVTHLELAVSLAQLGGMAVLPAAADPHLQARTVRDIKHYKAGFQTDLVTLSADVSLTELTALIAETGYTTFPVTDSGLFHGKLLGLITDKDYDSRDSGTVAERMRRDIEVGVDLDNLREANSLMIKAGRGVLPIVTQDYTLKSVVFKKDLDKHLHHPQGSEDELKRLCVGAAISTHPGDADRIKLLADAEVDFFVIDASDGFSYYQADTIRSIKSQYATPVIAGNVVTSDGFCYLAEAGADAVKVGMGVGSGCTTLKVKATGRGQASALLSVCSARDDYYRETNSYIPVIADGSVSSAADIAIALALGADSVMMGNFFARCNEAAGDTFVKNGSRYKHYWMEGSAKARNLRRYHQTNKTFFEEGVSGFVPIEGSIFEILPQTVQKLKSIFSTCGCESIEALHRRAVLELQSPAARLQSGIQNLQIDLSS